MWCRSAERLARIEAKIDALGLMMKLPVTISEAEDIISRPDRAGSLFGAIRATHR
jgi:hypothetical protein